MSSDNRSSEEAISPTICPVGSGRIGEGEDRRDTNSESDSRRRDKSQNSRPKGSNLAAPDDKSQKDDETEIDIPESGSVPKTPSLEEYTKHQVTHYPFKEWCPICVKNAAKNKPHKKVTNIRETEIFNMDYMYMTSKPTQDEIAHPILVIKARISGGVWALPVTCKGPYLSNVVQRINNIITSVGCPKIIIKADQEPAMVSLQKEVRKELWNEIIDIMNRVKGTKHRL